MSLLAIHWNVDPNLLTLGSFGLRWYSLLFVGGFIVGYYLFKWFFKNEGLPWEKLLDPVLYTLLLGTIVGARLGHCLFYQPDYYLTSWEGFVEIFQPWKGGLASHGGAIALLLAMWWYANHYGKKYDFDYLWVMDKVVMTVCFAGAMIRLGNLFNSEIYGDVTTLPWGVIFERNGETLPKHPTQIYEALCYLALGFALVGLYKYRLDRLYRGEIFGIFLICLFGARFLIEFIKEPQVGFEENMLLNMGQLLSIPFILAGVVILFLSVKVWKKPARVVHPTPKKAEKTHYAHGV